MRISTMRVTLSNLLKKAGQGLIWTDDEKTEKVVSPFCYLAEACGWQETCALDLLFEEEILPLKKNEKLKKVYALAKESLEALASELEIKLHTAELEKEADFD